MKDLFCQKIWTRASTMFCENEMCSLIDPVEDGVAGVELHAG